MPETIDFARAEIGDVPPQPIKLRYVNDRVGLEFGRLWVNTQRAKGLTEFKDDPTFPLTARLAAKAIFHTGAIADLSNFHAEYGNDSTRRNKVDYDEVVEFNQAIRKMIDVKTDVGIPTQELISQLLIATEHSTPPGENWNEEKCREEIETIITGQLSEKKAANLLTAANIRHYHSSLSQDLHQDADGFIKSQSKGYIYAYDNKNSFTGVKDEAERAGNYDYKIYEFTADSFKELKPGDERLKGTFERPVIHLSPLHGHFVLSVDTGKKALPENLISEQFDPEHSKAAILAMQAARHFMDDYAENNKNIDRYRMVNGQILSQNTVPGRQSFADFARQATARANYASLGRRH